LLEDDTQHTHKKKICIYIFTKKEKEKYKPGYETRTRQIINVHLFFFYYSFKVVDVDEYLMLIMEGEDNVLYVELNVLVIIELLLVVNVQLNLTSLFEDEMDEEEVVVIHLRFVHDDEHLDLILAVNLC